MRAAGLPPIKTVAEPLTTESGGPTQTQLSPTTAAGSPPINTVGQPGPTIGPPTWGIGGVPGVCIGQVCRSVTRAAGGMSRMRQRCNPRSINGGVGIRHRDETSMWIWGSP